MRFKTCDPLDGGVLRWWLHIWISDILIKQSHLIPTCYHLSWGPSCIIYMEVESSCWWKAIFTFYFPVGDYQHRKRSRVPMADGFKSSEQLIITTAPVRAELMHDATWSLFPDFRRGTLILECISSDVQRSELFDEYRWFIGLRKVYIPQKKESMQLREYTVLAHIRKLFLSPF